MKKRIPILSLILVFMWACKSIAPEPLADSPNPAHAGFNAATSDTAAIRIADEVMRALGGRATWDQCHYLRWTFFGKRTLVWDKWDGRVRINAPGRALVVMFDLDDMSGTVYKDKILQTDPDTIKKYVEWGKNVWINDSYWLLMPYKLKDSGVTLRYLGLKPNMYEVDSDVLQLTFDEVGATPNNKYHVYVNPSSHLVTQWDYFENYTDTVPKFQSPWMDWRPAGGLFFSTNRGKEGYITEIANLKSVPDSAFTSVHEPNWSQVIYPTKKKKK